MKLDKRCTTQLGILVTAVALMSLTATSSFAVTYKYGVMTTGSNAGGFPDPLPGTTLTGSAATNDPSVTSVIFKWNDPSGNTIQTSTDTSSTPAGGGDCLTTATKYTGGVTQADVTSGAGFKCFSSQFTLPATPGDWGMQALFCNDSGVCSPPNTVEIRAISFNVLPESPLGIAALVGSSLAALAGYSYFRSKKATSVTGNL